MRLRKYFGFVSPAADARIKEFDASLICIRNARNLCTNRPVYETPVYESSSIRTARNLYTKRPVYEPPVYETTWIPKYTGLN